MTPEIDKNNEYYEKSFPKEIVNRNVHDKLTDDNKTGPIITVVDDSNPEYSGNCSPEMIVEAFMSGKLSSYKRYNELFSKAIHNKNYYYGLSPTPLERLVDNFRDKKNQIINKVIGFVKKLGIFEK